MSTRPPPSAGLLNKEEDPTAAEQKFREVYEQNVELVWHMLRRLSVAEKDVMDAAQNVFLVVHRRLPEFEGRSSVRTWLKQIARRVASDYRRSASVRREVHTDGAELDIKPGRGESAEDSAARTERIGLARSILDSMPESQRTVFIMYELEQMSGAEIADDLGVPLGTVRSRLRLAREAFRNQVAQLRAVTPKLEAG